MSVQIVCLWNDLFIYMHLFAVESFGYGYALDMVVEHIAQMLLSMYYKDCGSIIDS